MSNSNHVSKKGQIFGLRIAIDGPAGAGKSTVAKKLARNLRCKYVDTGAMYRAVAYAALNAAVPPEDTGSLSRLAETLNFGFCLTENEETRVYVNGRDASREIRSPEVSRFVSLVAKVPGVRKHLTDKQRTMAVSGGVVMEGRDIGTVVLPDAEYKFFITATVEERARRRFLEASNQGHRITPVEQLQEIESRDKQDSSREIAPLVPAPDAIVIDTTGKSPEQVVEMILAFVRGG
ncbi:MAG: (d)CMP kinase [Bacillota bacterium]